MKNKHLTFDERYAIQTGLNDAKMAQQAYEDKLKESREDISRNHNR